MSATAAGVCRVTIHEAKGLVPSLGDTCSPVAKIFFGNSPAQSCAVAPNTRDPHWNEIFEWPVSNATEAVRVQIWDDQIQDLLGEFKTQIGIPKNSEGDRWFALNPIPSGEVRMSWVYSRTPSGAVPGGDVSMTLIGGNTAHGSGLPTDLTPDLKQCALTIEPLRCKDVAAHPMGDKMDLGLSIIVESNAPAYVPGHSPVSYNTNVCVASLAPSFTGTFSTELYRSPPNWQTFRSKETAAKPPKSPVKGRPSSKPVRPRSPSPGDLSASASLSDRGSGRGDSAGSQRVSSATQHRGSGRGDSAGSQRVSSATQHEVGVVGDGGADHVVVFTLMNYRDDGQVPIAVGRWAVDNWNISKKGLVQLPLRAPTLSGDDSGAVLASTVFRYATVAPPRKVKEAVETTDVEGSIAEGPSAEQEVLLPQVAAREHGTCFTLVPPNRIYVWVPILQVVQFRRKLETALVASVNVPPTVLPAGAAGLEASSKSTASKSASKAAAKPVETPPSITCMDELVSKHWQVQHRHVLFTRIRMAAERLRRWEIEEEEERINGPADDTPLTPPDFHWTCDEELVLKKKWARDDMLRREVCRGFRVQTQINKLLRIYITGFEAPVDGEDETESIGNVLSKYTKKHHIHLEQSLLTALVPGLSSRVAKVIAKNDYSLDERSAASLETSLGGDAGIFGHMMRSIAHFWCDTVTEVEILTLLEALGNIVKKARSSFTATEAKGSRSGTPTKRSGGKKPSALRRGKGSSAATTATSSRATTAAKGVRVGGLQ